jgi:hypothetical protein
VLRRSDRHQLRGRIEAELTAPGDDGRKALLEKVGAKVPGVEPDVVGAGLQHRGDHALGDDVAWGEFGQRVAPHHEPPTFHVT